MQPLRHVHHCNPRITSGKIHKASSFFNLMSRELTSSAQEVCTCSCWTETFLGRADEEVRPCASGGYFCLEVHNHLQCVETQCLNLEKNPKHFTADERTNMLQFAGLCLQFQLDNHLLYLCIFCHIHHWEMCKTQELLLIFSIVASHLHCLCIVCNNHPWEIYKAQELLLMVPN